MFDYTNKPDFLIVALYCTLGSRRKEFKTEFDFKAAFVFVSHCFMQWWKSMPVFIPQIHQINLKLICRCTYSSLHVFMQVGPICVLDTGKISKSSKASQIHQCKALDNEMCIKAAQQETVLSRSGRNQPVY